MKFWIGSIRDFLFGIIDNSPFWPILGPVPLPPHDLKSPPSAPNPNLPRGPIPGGPKNSCEQVPLPVLLLGVRRCACDARRMGGLSGNDESSGAVERGHGGWGVGGGDGGGRGRRMSGDEVDRGRIIGGYSGMQNII